jgi:hypothetical protein
MKEIEAEKKAGLDKLGKQLAAVLKSVDACNGKDIDKKSADALKIIKADAGSQKAAAEAKFDSALAALAQKLRSVPKPAAKTPAPAAPAPAAAKKGAAGMAKTYRKLGLEAIVKARTRPQMKPSRFMVAEFKKSVLFYMGMKYDKAKTTETLKAMNPNDTFVRTYVDPNSKVIWEKNALTLVSNKIPPKFATRMTKSSKLILGRAFKIRMRTESGQADEPEEAAADEMSEAELKAELAKMAGDADIEDDEDDFSVDSVGDDDEKDSDAPAAAKKHAPGAAAKSAAATGPAAKSPAVPAGANRAVETARKQWVDTQKAAKAEIDGLFAEIGKLYGKGQEAQLEAARVTLENCMRALSKLDNELEALLLAKDSDERAQKVTRARNTADALIQFVSSNKVMVNLDENEVRRITAGEEAEQQPGRCQGSAELSGAVPATTGTGAFGFQPLARCSATMLV